MRRMTAGEAQRYTGTVLTAYELTRGGHPDAAPDDRINEAADVLLRAVQSDPVNLAMVCAALCDRLTDPGT